VGDDLLALYQLWESDGVLDTTGRLDLGGIGGGSATAAASRASVGTQRGLKTLCKQVLGVDLPKSKRQATSDSSQVALNELQLAYSVRDEWTGAHYDEKTFGHLLGSRGEMWPKRRWLDCGNHISQYPQRMCSKQANIPRSVQAQVQELRNVIQSSKRAHLDHWSLKWTIWGWISI
jgi:hypothetical protein